jgi:hypothetical protein
MVFDQYWRTVHDAKEGTAPEANPFLNQGQRMAIMMTKLT